MTQIRLREHDAGEERAERERDIEQHRRAVCDAERDRQHGEREELARARARDLVQDPRHDAAPADEHERDEDRDLQRREPEAEQELAGLDRSAAGRRRERGQEHQREHHREILDDEPADGDPAVQGIELVALFECTQQHDRARDRQCQPENEACGEAPAPP
jgi:hypothetical protein